MDMSYNSQKRNKLHESKKTQSSFSYTIAYAIHMLHQELGFHFSFVRKPFITFFNDI